MTDRIDALGPSSTHLAAVTPELLDRLEDPVLQEVVQEASELLGAPIALVSIVLRRLQYFRASVGLTGDLSETRATDRDVSFCQFVVRDQAVFQVDDAATDARVPQILVRDRGVRAYLGAPVRADGVVVGSLCVLDTAPRSFTEAERLQLVALADRVTSRFHELARRREAARLELGRAAVQPAFPEVRNLLVPLLANAQSARTAVAELEPLIAWARVSGALPEDLGRAALALRDLQDILSDTEEVGVRLSGLARALETVAASGAQTVELGGALQAARELAGHRLRLLSRCSFPAELPDDPLALPGSWAVSILASMLGDLGHSLASVRPEPALQVRVAPVVPGLVGLRFDVPDVPAALLPAAERLGALLDAQPLCRSRLTADGLDVYFTVHTVGNDENGA